jgi:hypothetical protein
MKHLKLAVLLAVAVLFGSGCHGGRGLGPAIFAGGMLAGVAISSSGNHYGPSGYQREELSGAGPIYQTIVVMGPQSEPLPSRVTAPPAPRAPAFDPVATRTALARVDLAKCRETGAPRGYGHAKVTLNPSGDISKVVIDEPIGMSAAAAKCIGDEIGRTTVPVFDGSFVTVGTTWFVP